MTVVLVVDAMVVFQYAQAGSREYIPVVPWFHACQIRVEL
jgi:hypothetical protein